MLPPTPTASSVLKFRGDGDAGQTRSDDGPWSISFSVLEGKERRETVLRSILRRAEAESTVRNLERNPRVTNVVLSPAPGKSENGSTRERGRVAS